MISATESAGAGDWIVGLAAGPFGFGALGDGVIGGMCRDRSGGTNVECQFHSDRTGFAALIGEQTRV